MKVLIIEDDPKVSSYIKKGLKQEGHACHIADTGSDGLFLATTEKYDVIVVDRMLPELDGLTVLKTLRGAGNQTPILILSALGEVDDRVKGLKAGGDDYLVKPFAFQELIARLEVLNRRSTKATAETRLVVEDLEMDLLGRKVMRAGKTIELLAREFNLLEYLMRLKRQVVTRTMLLENIWDYHFDPQTNVIDVHISRLRSKIDKGFKKPLIRTIRGAGYIIDDYDNTA